VSGPIGIIGLIEPLAVNSFDRLGKSGAIVTVFQEPYLAVSNNHEKSS
jgi:hypothetical protein